MKTSKRRLAILTGCLPNYFVLAEHTIFRNKFEYAERHGYRLETIDFVYPRYADPRSHASGFSWSRLARLLELLRGGDYDWVWVVGCDTLVTNITIPLDTLIDEAESPAAEQMPLPRCPPLWNSPAPPPVINWTAPEGHKWTGRKHLLICGERVTSMQADSFLVKASPEGIAYVTDLLSHYEEYKHHVWVENQAMIDLRDKWAALTYMVPQWRLNCVDYTRWHNLRPYYRDNTDFWGNRGNWQHGDFLIHWPAASLEQRLVWLPKYEREIVR